jgi:hypothetical protein
VLGQDRDDRRAVLAVSIVGLLLACSVLGVLWRLLRARSSVLLVPWALGVGFSSCILVIAAATAGPRSWSGMGYVIRGRSDTFFRACDRSDRVWLAFNTPIAGRDDLVRALSAGRRCSERVLSCPERRAFVHLTGTLSGAGNYGPNGNFEREIAVREVVLLRSSECSN